MASTTELHRTEMASAMELHRTEIARATEQHHDEIAHLTRELADMRELHYTQNVQSNDRMMAFISGRDAQTSVLHRDLDILNKTVLRLVGTHKDEIEHLRRLHYRRLLEVGARTTGNEVAGMTHTPDLIRI